MIVTATIFIEQDARVGQMYFHECDGVAEENLYNGQSLFGGNGIKLGSTDAAVNGLYGVGRYAYTENFTSSLFAVTTGSVTFSDVDLDSTYVATGSYKKLTVAVGDNAGSRIDLNAVRSFALSGSSIDPTLQINELTKVYNVGTLASPNYKIQLIVTGSQSPVQLSY